MTDTPALDEVVDTLPMTEEEWWGLTEALAEAAAEARSSGAAHHGRRDKRVPVHEVGTLAIIRLTNPCGREDLFKVRLRNLSRSGVGFFHGQELVVNTPCTVGLADPAGRYELHSSRVVRCRPVKKRGQKVFEVGLRFSKPIDHFEPDGGGEA